MGSPQNSIFRIGTRESALALKQTHLIIEALKQHYPNHQFDIIPIKTTGDRHPNRSFLEFGSKGIFTTELQSALLNHDIDMAIHSLKDMTGGSPPGLSLSAFRQAESSRDVLISKDNISVTWL